MSIIRSDAFQWAANTIKIEFTECGFSELDSKWRKQDVCSPYSRLYYVISGKGYLRIPGHPDGNICSGEQGNRDESQLYELLPGHLYLIPNGLSYDYFCDDRLEKVYFHINVLLQNGLELFSGCRDYYELSVGEELLQQMKQWMLSKRPEDYFHMQGEIYHAAAAFMDKAGVADKVNRQYSGMVSEVFALLPGLKMSVTVQELAGIMNVSESTLTKHFKKETGMSIGDYRELIIMSRARQLLAMGRLSVREVAEELGFGDQFYFSKYFKQRQGMPPSAYKSVYKI